MGFSAKHSTSCVRGRTTDSEGDTMIGGHFGAPSSEERRRPPMPVLAAPLGRNLQCSGRSAERRRPPMTGLAAPLGRFIQCSGRPAERRRRKHLFWRPHWAATDGRCSEIRLRDCRRPNRPHHENAGPPNAKAKRRRRPLPSLQCPLPKCTLRARVGVGLAYVDALDSRDRS